MSDQHVERGASRLLTTCRLAQEACDRFKQEVSLASEPTVRNETLTLDGMRFYSRDQGDPVAPRLLLPSYLQRANTWELL
jgi:hypothetical protein